MTDYRNQLVEQLRSDRVVAVVGAGISKGVSGRAATADWVGLVRAGITEVGSKIPEHSDWAVLQGMQLDLALKSETPADLISVASNVSSKLKQSSTQALSNWLSDTVGELQPLHKEVPVALAQLSIPILTTNYDTLLEQSLGRSSADWTDSDAMRECFLKGTKSIGHLHGIWNKPDSVILSQSDYDRLLADKRAQFVQQSQYSTKSFLYIGYGSGLDDPNFSKLLEEHGFLFPSSHQNHFRLCREADFDALQMQHRDSDIKVVCYGAEFSDLPIFIEGLAEEISANTLTTTVRRDYLAFAREAIVEQIKTDGATAHDSDSTDFKDLDDLTVAPVLLPMSHEQFASMQSVEKGQTRPERLDPSRLIQQKKLLIVVGEEHSGLTTAVRWLVAKAALASAGVAPIYIDARLTASTTRPIAHLVQKEALHLRLIDRQLDQIPPHALAVDNVIYRENHTYDRIISDLLQSEAQYLVVGCRLGDEQQIAVALEKHALPIEIAHIGKMSRTEIDALATLIAPDSPRNICDSVLEIAHREHLPRNPFTISLLISLVSQLGRRNEAYNSETSVLDEYVKLLLGKNGAHIDARITLTAQNREKIISDIAMLFVRRRKGSLPSFEVSEHMVQSFAALGWKEVADDWLASFKDARVLRQVGNDIQFQQSSYLHLFAAKAAISDENFRNEMFDDPLYFAPIIRHFAALLRNSRYAVLRMSTLLDAWTDHEAKGRAFGKVERRVAPEISSAEDDEYEGGDNKAEPERPTGKDGVPAEDSTESAPEYDVSDDTDMVPFPLTDQSDLSPANLLVNSVDLVSRVVRDSDELQDNDLKAEVLGKALSSWGVLIDEFETEEVFKPAVEMVMQHLKDEHKMEDEKVDHMYDRLKLYLPSFYALAGMQSTLASRKLLLTFERLLDDPNFGKKEFGPVAAAMFAFLLAERGWSAHLAPLAESHGDRWIVTGLLASLARMAYLRQPLTVADDHQVLEFLRACELKRWSFDSKFHRDRHMAKFDQNLAKARLQNTSRRLAPGKTVAGEMLG